MLLAPRDDRNPGVNGGKDFHPFAADAIAKPVEPSVKVSPKGQPPFD
jgi:hypothetical protein